MIGCSENTRKIVLQLKMIELGFYGLGDGSAGMFLADHYSQVGPYFGNLDEHEWPHSPFVNEPSLLELNLNQKMMEMTDILSHGKLKDVSILDVPAFGSKISWLYKRNKRESNWPTEMNFEAFKQRNGSFPTMFKEYKQLLEDWEHYMRRVYKNDPDITFTPTMENDVFLNTTQYIKKDMRAFLIAIVGSHMNPTNHLDPVWKNIAQMMFKNLRSDDHASLKGVSNKVIMYCKLRKNLLRNGFDVGDSTGCDIFLPTLTSNGLCHTFNGQTPFETWNKAEVVTEFQNLFPMAHAMESYHGAGNSEGNHSLRNFNMPDS